MTATSAPLHRRHTSIFKVPVAAGHDKITFNVRTFSSSTPTYFKVTAITEDCTVEHLLPVNAPVGSEGADKCWKAAVESYTDFTYDLSRFDGQDVMITIGVFKGEEFRHRRQTLLPHYQHQLKKNEKITDILYGLILSVWVSCASCEKTNGNGTPDTSDPDIITHEEPATQNLLRAMQITDKTTESYFNQTTMAMTEILQPFTGSSSSGTVDVWPYGSAIEAVNAINACRPRRKRVMLPSMTKFQQIR